MNQKKFYPEFAAILQEELKPSTLMKDMVKDLIETGLTDSEARLYLKGYKTKVDQKVLKRIAEYIYGRGSEAENLLSRLTVALNKPVPLRSGRILEDLRSEAIDHLTIKGLVNAPFSGSPEQFFESVFFRFFNLAGLPFRYEKIQHGFKQRDHDEADVVMGIFDSADRMVRLGLKFWRVPIRFGIGALCHRRHVNEADRIARILANLEPMDRLMIRPIVVTDEIGYLHCRHRLGYKSVADKKGRQTSKNKTTSRSLLKNDQER